MPATDVSPLMTAADARYATRLQPHVRSTFAVGARTRDHNGRHGERARDDLLELAREGVRLACERLLEVAREEVRERRGHEEAVERHLERAVVDAELCSKPFVQRRVLGHPFSRHACEASREHLL